METLRKNVNKNGICLLGSRPIDLNKGLELSNAEMKLKCQNYCEHSEMIFFWDVLCVSRPCEMRVSQMHKTP